MLILENAPRGENFISIVHNFQRGTGEASLQNVQFKYPTRQTIQVLKNLDLEIENGKTIALVGASGCGKSTIIQLLERYYDPDSGIVVGHHYINSTVHLYKTDEYSLIYKLLLLGPKRHTNTKTSPS